MKYLFCLLLCFLIVYGAFAQTCDVYYPTTEGQKWTLGFFDKKDKPVGSTTYEVLSTTDDGNSVVGSYRSTTRLPKSDEIVTEFEASCSGTSIELDMASVYAGSFMQTYDGMEVDIESDVFTLPSDAKAGDELPDINLTIKAGMSGISMTTKVDHTDRKIIGRESISTEAGTFDCLKISYTQSAKVVVAKVVQQVTEWHAIGVGLVRSETYKKGKLTGTTVLTEYSK